MTNIRWTIVAGIIVGLIVLIILWGFVALTPAHAQANPCGPAAQMIAEITGTKYGEVPVFKALAAGTPVAIFANRKTGTWTALVLMPEGRACIFGAGTSFEDAPASLTGEPT